MEKITRQMVGAYGEWSVTAELLRNGWTPANVNATVKNAKDFDIYAVKGDKTVRLQVKACGPQSNGVFQLSGYDSKNPIAKKSFPSTDFTILVSMGHDRSTDEFYILPSSIVHEEIRLRQKEYMEVLKKNGEKRVDNGYWTLRLRKRNNNNGMAGYGLKEKWTEYLNAWKKLEA